MCWCEHPHGVVTGVLERCTVNASRKATGCSDDHQTPFDPHVLRHEPQRQQLHLEMFGATSSIGDIQSPRDGLRVQRRSFRWRYFESFDHLVSDYVYFVEQRMQEAERARRPGQAQPKVRRPGLREECTGAFGFGGLGSTPPNLETPSEKACPSPKTPSTQRQTPCDTVENFQNVTQHLQAPFKAPGGILRTFTDQVFLMGKGIGALIVLHALVQMRASDPSRKEMVGGKGVRKEEGIGSSARNLDLR